MTEPVTDVSVIRIDQPHVRSGGEPLQWVEVSLGLEPAEVEARGRAVRVGAPQASEHVAGHLHNPQPSARVWRQHVHRAARDLELAHLASSTRNGFVARSAASVVIPMWPGWTAVSPGSDSTRLRIDSSSVP